MTHDSSHGIEKLNEMRLLGTLNAISDLMDTHGIEKWANWFRSDLEDYLAARGQPNQNQRQLAVITHILTAFGGMSEFSSLALKDENGAMLTEENEKLRELASHLWAGARGLQAAIMSK
jgi:hypothetical protein